MYLDDFRFSNDGILDIACNKAIYSRLKNYNKLRINLSTKKYKYYRENNLYFKYSYSNYLA